MTSQKRNAETHLELLRESFEHGTGIQDRHTRHYYNAKHRLSDEEWASLRRAAQKRFKVDVDKLAERGATYYDNHDIDPPRTDEGQNG